MWIVCSRSCLGPRAFLEAWPLLGPVQCPCFLDQGQDCRTCSGVWACPTREVRVSRGPCVSYMDCVYLLWTACARHVQYVSYMGSVSRMGSVLHGQCVSYIDSVSYMGSLCLTWAVCVLHGQCVSLMDSVSHMGSVYPTRVACVSHEQCVSHIDSTCLGWTQRVSHGHSVSHMGSLCLTWAVCDLHGHFVSHMGSVCVRVSHMGSGP